MSKHTTIYGARRIVKLCLEKNMSYEDMATLCSSALGSVKRWMATDTANKHKIQPLLDIVGNISLSSENVARILINLYETKPRRRYRISRAHLKLLSNRDTLPETFIHKISEYLLERRYCFIEAIKNKNDIFIIVGMSQLLNYVQHEIKEEDLKEYITSSHVAVAVDDEEDE